MPLELLRDISKKSLPLTIADAADIDKLRVLSTAGRVAVLLPKADSKHQLARVLAITPAGWAMIGDSGNRRIPSE